MKNFESIEHLAEGGGDDEQIKSKENSKFSKRRQSSVRREIIVDGEFCEFTIFIQLLHG
jgi:hypothetical protein